METDIDVRIFCYLEALQHNENIVLIKKSIYLLIYLSIYIQAYTDWSGMVGKKIRKKFGRKFFDGDVVEYDSNKHLFKVFFIQFYFQVKHFLQIAFSISQLFFATYSRD